MLRQFFIAASFRMVQNPHFTKSKRNTKLEADRTKIYSLKVKDHYILNLGTK
jgi:plasmid maintenance system killer protein